MHGRFITASLVSLRFFKQVIYMQSIKSYQEDVQQAIDKLISAVEVQHNALSSVTFTYAGKYTNLLKRKSAHDNYSYIAYGKARKLNKLVGDKTGEVIVRIEGPKSNKDKVKVKSKKVLKSAQAKAQAAKTSISKVSQEALR